MVSISDVYVWVWLPGSTAPVPAGVLRDRGGGLLGFQYGRGYLSRPDAVALSPTMPLGDGVFDATGSMGLPSAIRDAAPDAWGRRVVQYAHTGKRGVGADTGDLREVDYLLGSATDRFGGIDFQASPREYVARDADSASLDDLLGAADAVEAGVPLPYALGRALLSGTAMGGARPKAVVHDGDTAYIAKFSATTDTWNVVGAEAAAMYLAGFAGIDVPTTKVVAALHRTTLLVERFDRPSPGARTLAVSALTLGGLDEMTSRYGTYPEFLEQLRSYGARAGTGEELFRRIAFNMAISNSDDHLRNHAALWDGTTLQLSPAYDLAPGSRSGWEGSILTSYDDKGSRRSNLHELTRAAMHYALSVRRASEIVDEVVGAIHDHWDDAAEHARLTIVDKESMWGRQFLNPGSLDGLGR